MPPNPDPEIARQLDDMGPDIVRARLGDWSGFMKEQAVIWLSHRDREAREQAEASAAEQSELARTTSEAARRSNELAAEANSIARDANDLASAANETASRAERRAKTSNRIALVSAAAAVIAALTSIATIWYTSRHDSQTKAPAPPAAAPRRP